MSYMLPKLETGWDVDQAIVSEDEKVVLIRFAKVKDLEVMKMDEVLYSISEPVSRFCTIYIVDTKQVPEFNKLYELTDNMNVMFFYRNKHIMVDTGTGDNNKITWCISDKQDMIDIIEVVYRAANKGRGLVVAPKEYSKAFAY